MDNEMDDVSLVRMVFNACGKKEVEVKTAANKPVREVQSIQLQFNSRMWKFLLNPGYKIITIIWHPAIY